MRSRSSPPEVFLRKDVLKICSKFTGKHPCRSVISIKLLRNGCSPVNLLHISRSPFPKNTSGELLLKLFFLRRGGGRRGAITNSMKILEQSSFLFFETRNEISKTRIVFAIYGFCYILKQGKLLLNSVFNFSFIFKKMGV